MLSVVFCHDFFTSVISFYGDQIRVMLYYSQLYGKIFREVVNCVVKDQIGLTNITIQFE